MPSRILGAMFAAVMLTLGACEQKRSTPPRATADETAKAAEAEAKVKEAVELATDAYVYAYPLVTMEYTRRATTRRKAETPLGAPMGQLVSLREYPTAAFESVTAPNADTLCTSMWLDYAMALHA